MNKTLKFESFFADTIKGKDKITTSRLFDEKNLSLGDDVDFLNADTGEKFATGKITAIKETTFAEMVKDAADIQGMYQTYKFRYKREIKPEDKVKLVAFDILKA